MPAYRSTARSKLTRRPFLLGVVLFGLAALLVIGARFELAPVRGDAWIVNRSTHHVCTLGFEAVEPPCWPGLAEVLARSRLVRPNGANWAVSQNASMIAGLAAVDGGRCSDATVWYADDARNVFLSDRHAYAVGGTGTVPSDGAVRVCAVRTHAELVALRFSGGVLPAIRMR